MDYLENAQYGYPDADEIAQLAPPLFPETEEPREEAELQACMDAEMAEILKLDPAVKNAEDIMRLPTARKFCDYIRRGISLTDAFCLANREKLASMAAASVKQQTMNNARGKNHLATSAPRGGGAMTVPPDEMKIFKALNPDATNAEIQTFYNQFMRQQQRG
jgi:hypothetical protein